MAANTETTTATPRARQLPQTAEQTTPIITPTHAARSRWPCSNRTGKSAHQPSGLKLPKLRGQSGTAMPACQLVTNPPTKMRQKTNATAKRAVQLRFLIFKSFERIPEGPNQLASPSRESPRQTVSETGKPESLQRSYLALAGAGCCIEKSSFWKASKSSCLSTISTERIA